VPDLPAPDRLMQWDVLLAIAAGGVLGAEARYGISLALPHSGRQFPWATLLINASGCVAIAILMVVLLDVVENPHRLARPLLGIGILGGYTTFSTFALDVDRLVMDHRPLTAGLYLIATVLACALSVWAATSATRAIAGSPPAPVEPA
jgi:CrcB protein